MGEGGGIALFSERPVQAEFRRDYDEPWQPCLWLGTSNWDDSTYFLVVHADGHPHWWEFDTDHFRTMWRWDPDLLDWIDTGEPQIEPEEDGDDPER